MATWMRYAFALLIGIGIGYLASRFVEDEVFVSLPSAPAQPALVSSDVTPATPAQAPGRNAPASLADIMLITSDYSQTAALYNLAGGVSRERLEGLLEEASGMSQDSERRAASAILYERYAELDPEAAIEYLLSHPGVYTNQWLSRVFHAWSRHDLPSAVERASELDRYLRSVAGSAILNARDDLPSSERREIAGQLGILAMMRQLESQRQIAMTDRDPESAWRNALDVENLQFRTRNLYTVAAIWANIDPVAAMNAVSSLDQVGLRGSIQAAILQRWGQRSPHEAVAWAFSQAPSNQRATLLATALGALAITEPLDAMNLAQSLSGNERSEALSRILGGWAATDPRSAADWFESTSGAYRTKAVHNVASNYAQKYPEEAFNWAISLAKQESGMATMTVLSVISNSDSEYAARLVDRIPSQNDRNAAAQTVVQMWAQSNPAAAGAWIAGFADKNLQTQLYSSLLQQWSRHDPVAAVGYLDRIPGGETRDAATVVMIVNARDNLQFAEDLFERIENDEQRRKAAQQLYHMLRVSDSRRAEQYRIAGGLDESGSLKLPLDR
ncbi:MAG: hypothetical protein O7E57_09710 [Gammaproteobacteria bacterium]|nr:hypothetical protein [Gammaproteobacteria bacterium]